MKLDLMVRVSPDGKLEIPAEIETQFKPGDQYRVTITVDTIIF